MNHYHIRATMDIDSFYNANEEVQNIILLMGNEYGLNPEDEVWLNNSVQSMNKKPPEEICQTIYEFSNLTVKIPPLEYIACMKLVSAREQDITDVSELIKMLEIKDPEEMEGILKKYDFGTIDESLILEAFGRAYGMQWLEDYYIAKYENPGSKDDDFDITDDFNI